MLMSGLHDKVNEISNGFAEFNTRHSRVGRFKGFIESTDDKREASVPGPTLFLEGHFATQCFRHRTYEGGREFNPP